mgnify:FL=1
MKTVNSSEGKCFPWHGHFAADEITPVDDNGDEHLPGVRRCGNNDCCNVEHIEMERGQ